MPGNATRGLARITELAAINGAVAGLSYRSANWAQDWDNPNTWRASASYVTGAHSFKFGYVGGYLVEDIENHGNDLNLAYTFNNGVPISVTESLRVFTQSDRVRYDALYGQDQWTMGKHHAAGRAALRPRVQLLAAADDRPGAHRRADVPGDAADVTAAPTA